MADVAISALAAAAALDGTEQVPIVQSSTTVRASAAALAASDDRLFVPWSQMSPSQNVANYFGGAGDFANQVAYMRHTADDKLTYVGRLPRWLRGVALDVAAVITNLNNTTTTDVRLVGSAQSFDVPVSATSHTNMGRIVGTEFSYTMPATAHQWLVPPNLLTGAVINGPYFGLNIVRFGTRAEDTFEATMGFVGLVLTPNP